jgi:hypothetical protein
VQTVRLLALSTLISTLTLPTPGWAEAGAEPGPAPYEPWSGPAPFQRADAPVLRDAPPPPLVAAPENGRRPFELALGVGLGLPRCSDGSIESERCALLGSGLGGDLIALYRVTPFFAFGGDVGLNRFGPNESSAGSLFAGVLGRVYFLGEGSIDPHFELALGGGSLTTSARESASSMSFRQKASGPAARVGAGIDFSIGTSVRLGPALDLTTYLVDSVRRCDSGGPCVEHSLRSYAHPTGFASLSFRLSIAFGKPM